MKKILEKVESRFRVLQLSVDPSFFYFVVLSSFSTISFETLHTSLTPSSSPSLSISGYARKLGLIPSESWGPRQSPVLREERVRFQLSQDSKGQGSSTNPVNPGR